jgi:serine/threonine protein phosphatase PrpC
VVVKDLAGVRGLWMFGVMDGHGANGHHVSEMVRKNMPTILAELIAPEGGESLNARNSLLSGKKGKKSVGSRVTGNYLPPLVSYAQPSNLK